jgi:hypothetical protein
MKLSVKIALGVVMFIAIAGILTALYIYNKEPVDTFRVKPDFTVNASDLFNEFASGENNATLKYADKIVEIKGKISAVRSDYNATTISLETSDPASAVLCTLNKIVDDSTLVIGDEITIRGECSGFLMDVLMKNCSIIK